MSERPSPTDWWLKIAIEHGFTPQSVRSITTWGDEQVVIVTDHSIFHVELAGHRAGEPFPCMRLVLERTR